MFVHQWIPFTEFSAGIPHVSRYNMYFRTIRDAHEHYGYPGSYQHGTIIDPKTETVIRSYSNGKGCDIIPKRYIGREIPPIFYYKIKTPVIYEAYRNTIHQKEGSTSRVRLFILKSPGNVLDAGLYRPERFYKGYVKLACINTSLYDDANPRSTTKGLGFRDKNTAEYTIRRIQNRDKTYQKQVVTTMYNRAKHHPHQTDGMREAMKVYVKWLQQNR